MASFTCSTFRTGHQFLVPEARSLARRAVLSTSDFKIMIMLKVTMNTIVVMIMMVSMVMYLFEMTILLKVPRAVRAVWKTFDFKVMIMLKIKGKGKGIHVMIYSNRR